MKTIPIAKYPHILILVDDDDYDKLKDYTWRLVEGYPARGCNANTSLSSPFILMTHCILPCKEGFVIDHVDQNRLNNQKINLRYLTYSQNNFHSDKHVRNTTGFKGVFSATYHGRVSYRARVCINQQRINLGSFKTAEEAAKAYDAYVKLHVGKVAHLNSP